jgi:hypothetical protein
MLAAFAYNLLGGMTITLAHRFAGPVFGFGRNPVLSLYFRREISNMGIRTISGLYGNEPATALYRLRFKIRERL